MGDSVVMSSSSPFVHLRAHSSYSLAEGMLPVKALVSQVAAMDQPALALTDSFNNFGALEFSYEAISNGIQPIIGAQVTLRDQTSDNPNGEIVLLVQNEEGWINLSLMMSKALLAGDHEPAIDLSELKKHSTGLIALSGGAKRGFVAAPLAENQPDLAHRRLKELSAIFPNRIYVELQRHGTEREARIEPGLLELAYALTLPLVATNDCYFGKRSDAAAHNVLLCISEGKTLYHEDRRQETEDHYLKSGSEMMALFADLPEAYENTAIIARRCAFAVKKRKPLLPPFATPDGSDEKSWLKNLAHQGLENRLKTLASTKGYENQNTDEMHETYQQRLDLELEIITQMGFAGYFLIVADFINWAKQQGIPVGPGRGSGAGSLVGYALGITDLDPIRWGLLFERFLNPERISMPDFDIDFCQDRREEVIAYVQQKYGIDRVAQIITFGSLQARAALRDAGRVMGMPYSQVDRIAKLVPSNPAKPVKLTEALKSEKDLKEAVNADEQVTDLMNVSIQIEGLLRHSSTHAAGLVIGDRPLAELVPLTQDPRSELPVTQFNMKSVEDAGLVKFDFLGLKTLTVLQLALDLIKRKGISLDLIDIPLEDEATFAMLGEGDTVGLFQLESSGMREVLKGLKPDRFEDIIAVVALYRPGPMENIPKYIARKHGREKVDYMHPLLEPVLDETYGIMIYQEQVQRAAQVLSGYSLGKADILRRAMGKKIASEMAAQRDEFVAGADANSIDKNLAGQIFDQISAFAGYGFNKSHAAAYALIAWQTAWLKRHHTAEFLAALMTLDMGNTDKLAVFRQDCLHYDIAMLPPSVNHSEANFTVEITDNGEALRYGLGAIRNVGYEVMKAIVTERDQGGAFASLEDFASRAGANLNRRMLENLIKAGALDDFGHPRATLFEAVERILSHAQIAKREAETSQDNLFNAVEGVNLDIPLKHHQEWDSKDRLYFEMEALGLYLSAHPLDDYKEQLAPLNITLASQISEKLTLGNEAVTLHFAGMVSSRQIRTSQSNNRYAFVQVTDPTGMIEFTLFSDILSASEAHLIENTPIYIKADARREDDRIKLLAREVLPLETAIDSKTLAMVVHVMEPSALEGIASGVQRDGEGRQKLLLKMHVQTHEVVIKLPGNYKLSQGCRQHIKSLDGVGSITSVFL